MRLSFASSGFRSFINECGCPGDFLKQWCSATTGVITAGWCNQSPENCNQCSGSVCYESDQPQDPPVTEEHHCYIDQCGCPGSFTEFWCSEDTAKITSPWCGESEEHCGMCGGSFCSADLEVIPVGPTGECFISQCGCPGSFKQEWCTETVAKITSEFCTFDEDHCGNHCAGTYCPVFNSYDAGPEGWCSSELNVELEPTVSAEACWAQCAGEYPGTLVSIDWWPEDGGNYCYCQGACDCMSNSGSDEPGAITLIIDNTDKPAVCSVAQPAAAPTVVSTYQPNVPVTFDPNEVLP